MSKRAAIALIAAAFVCGGVLTAGMGHTFAAWSDFQVVHESVSAGTWGGPPPASCSQSGFNAADIYALPNKSLPDPKTLNMPDNNHHVLVTGQSDAYSVTLGGGNDVVILRDGHDTVTLGGGNDCVITGNGPQQITLGDGDNIVQVGDGPNTITVGNGNNTITGGNGGATVSLGGGDNNVTFGNGPDAIVIRVDGGHNTITVGTGPATITGSGHNVCQVPSNKISDDNLTGCDTVKPT